VHAYDSIPEKWQMQWKEATVGTKPLILFEPLIAEILYQLTEKKGYNIFTCYCKGRESRYFYYRLWNS